LRKPERNYAQKAKGRLKGAVLTDLRAIRPRGVQLCKAGRGVTRNDQGGGKDCLKMMGVFTGDKSFAGEGCHVLVQDDEARMDAAFGVGGRKAI